MTAASVAGRRPQTECDLGEEVWLDERVLPVGIRLRPAEHQFHRPGVRRNGQPGRRRVVSREDCRGALPEGAVQELRRFVARVGVDREERAHVNLTAGETTSGTPGCLNPRFRGFGPGRTTRVTVHRRERRCRGIDEPVHALAVRTLDVDVSANARGKRRDDAEIEGRRHLAGPPGGE